MKNTNLINEIKKDFSFLKSKIKQDEVHSLLLYGSYVRSQQSIRSDIDICMVAPKFKIAKQQSKLLGYVWQNINADKYDVRLSEALPLYIKMEIIKNHEIIFTRNKAELYYYFYFFRKLWKDQSVNWIER